MIKKLQLYDINLLYVILAFLSLFFYTLFYHKPYLNTFLVNIIGCFVVGILIKYSAGVSKEIAEYLNYFLIIGFCGGFTTFSAYSVDSLNLLNEDKIIMFLIYSVLSSVIGILFCYLGMNIVK